MFEGQRIVGFTPVGRKRYMDILIPLVIREHERGLIDEWVVFDNAYLADDSTICQQMAAHLPWVTVVGEVHAAGSGDSPFKKFTHHQPGQIAGIYDFLTAGEGTIYIRLDDDICYIDNDAMPRLIKYRLEYPEPWLVFPTIVNNVRTAYHMQQQGVIPDSWGKVENNMADIVAHRNSDFVWNMHQKALTAIENGTLVEEFKLKSENFTDTETGRISINCFAAFGRDFPLSVDADEETFMSLIMCQKLGRFNARCGDAVICHFAYHRQALYMDVTGMLGDYARLNPPMPFRLIPVSPPFMTEGSVDEIKKPGQ